jgi:xylulokinase
MTSGTDRRLVAGIDSSTQSCKVVVRDAASGELLRIGRAKHPDGTEVDPARWWDALTEAVADAGGLDDVEAVSVGAQQHGSVLLDEAGDVVRPALLWNDGRSAAAAEQLTAELGGPQAWADEVGSVLVASLTITKLRWIAEHEPENVARTASVCLPHDWLTHRLAGGSRLFTDRGDASGTGYWSPAKGTYSTDLLAKAFGATPALPDVLGPAETGATSDSELTRGAVLAAGTGDNMAAALGVGAQVGDVVVSIGTSGVVSVVSEVPTHDPSGLVAGFADATGRFLPLVCTLNAARVLDSAARMLGVDHAALSRLALSAPVGSGGLVLVPYLEGERTPVRPDATGALHGLTLSTSTPAHLARATVEGLLCGLADGLDALVAQGVEIGRVVLVGGGARSEAVRVLAPAVLGRPVVVPEPGEYVADGAARQAAWALLGGEEAPTWTLGSVQTFEADPTPEVRDRYAQVRDLTADRLG